jgi:hypothetical protein
LGTGADHLIAPPSRKSAGGAPSDRCIVVCAWANDVHNEGVYVKASMIQLVAGHFCVDQAR